MGRKKDREKFAIHSVGIKVEDLEPGMILEFIHPKYCSFNVQRIHKIKGNKITMKNVVNEFTHITERNVRKIIKE